MSEWHIATEQTGQDGTPAFVAERRLSNDEHERLLSAHRTLSDTLGRTAWRILQRNYLSFLLTERQLASSSTDSSTGIRSEVEAVQVATTTVIVNFLFAMRMFLDLSETELKRQQKVDGIDRFSSWKAVCSAEYDDYFAYRFLYKFRNYVQHVGLPISSWSISSELKDSGQIVARALSGESLLDYKPDPEDVVTRILLSESPRDLIEKYGDWGSALREELESLTTEIDLSEQIHICMECLERVQIAYQDAFMAELSQAVDDFKAIVGDVAAYTGPPLLLRVEQNPPRYTMEITDLEIAWFTLAEHFVADQ